MNALKDFNGEDIFRMKNYKSKTTAIPIQEKNNRLKTDGIAVLDSPEDSRPLSNHFRAERRSYNDHTIISVQKNYTEI